ncbi:MAG: AI-2E family transporter [Chloroflexi bacterium]|nr:AI-2E family transporter [Chloroflexota bacterium]
MIKLEISFRGLVFIGLVAVLLWGLVRLWPILILILTALIFFAALLPYVEWLVKRGIRRTASVLLLLLAFVAILGGLGTLMIPPLVSEFGNIREQLPSDARQLDNFLAKFDANLNLEEKARNIDWGKVISGRAAINYGQQVLFAVFGALTTVVVTAYLLIDKPRLARFIFQFVPSGREPEVVGVLQSLSRVVGGYIRGQVITSVSIAVYTLVILLAVGAPNAIAFAVLAGFADIIPVVGAIIAILPPVVASLRESPTQALIVLALLILYQQFEDRFLVPRVYGSTLNLPPLIVFMAVLAGGELFGIPGVLLALPAVAAGRVGMEYLLEKHRRSLGLPLPTSEPLAPEADTKEAKRG